MGTFTAAPAAGAKLRASVFSAIATELRPIRAQITGTQALTTSSTAFQSIAGLLVPLAASTTYSGLAVVGGILSSGTTEDMRVGFTFPTGAVVRAWTTNLDSGVTSVFGNVEMVHRGTLTSGGVATFVGLNATTATFTQILLTIVNGVNAGNLQAQAAQVTSGGNTTTVSAGSFIEIRQST